MSATLAQVVSDFEEIASGSIVARCRKAVQTGQAVWVWDPEVNGVVGLVMTSNPRRALVVVYSEGTDFEVDGELLEKFQEATTCPRCDGAVAYGAWECFHCGCDISDLDESWS